uniref:Uncharacterized protein n=1 Tax=Glossina pallidipes TaxID=7398 RepID=A0A1B0A0X9_GLOPL
MVITAMLTITDTKVKAKMCKARPKQAYNYKDDDVENTEIIIISFDEDEPVSNDDIEILTKRADLVRKEEEQKLEKVEEKIEKKTEPESKAGDGKKTTTKLLTKRNEATNRLKLMKTRNAKFKIERFGSMGRAEHSHSTVKESLNNAVQRKSRKLKRKRQTFD